MNIEREREQSRYEYREQSRADMNIESRAEREKITPMNTSNTDARERIKGELRNQYGGTAHEKKEHMGEETPTTARVQRDPFTVHHTTRDIVERRSFASTNLVATVALVAAGTSALRVGAFVDFGIGVAKLDGDVALQLALVLDGLHGGERTHHGTFTVSDMPNGADVDGGLPADDLWRERVQLRRIHRLVLLGKMCAIHGAIANGERGHSLICHRGEREREV
jgi:hypothetical protein